MILFPAAEASPEAPTNSAMPLWLHWTILGLLAGTLAKFLVPGRDPSGCIVTLVLGLVGALLGGWIGSTLGWGSVSQSRIDLRSVGLATLGAVVVLLLGRLVRRGARR
jgi:uncharacterized membrane protein YeaQ/YmgE (transglycosylase-associated protein family)